MKIALPAIAIALAVTSASAQDIFCLPVDENDDMISVQRAGTKGVHTSKTLAGDLVTTELHCRGDLCAMAYVGAPSAVTTLHYHFADGIIRYTESIVDRDGGDPTPGLPLPLMRVKEWPVVCE